MDVAKDCLTSEEDVEALSPRTLATLREAFHIDLVGRMSRLDHEETTLAEIDEYIDQEAITKLVEKNALYKDLLRRGLDIV